MSTVRSLYSFPSKYTFLADNILQTFAPIFNPSVASKRDNRVRVLLVLLLLISMRCAVYMIRLEYHVSQSRSLIQNSWMLANMTATHY